MADGLGSIFAAFFGVLPNTSFSQNVGLVTVTKVVNRFTIMTGAIFLLLCGFCPKLSAISSVMPQSCFRGSGSYYVLYDFSKWYSVFNKRSS